MQKKIIALAIASAMAMPALALAEATVYGQANVAFEIVDDGGDGNGKGLASNSKNNVASNVSRIGVKGSEDLGGGLTGVFQMEGEVAMDTGTAGAAGTAAGATTSAAKLFNRNTFVGVAGGFGTVVLGQHDTPYKFSTRGMDVFADSIADNRSLMGLDGINLDIRATDVLAYITPDFSGLTVAVAMVGETDNSLAGVHAAVDAGVVALTPLTAATLSTASATTLSANYKRDNWSAAFGYIAANMKNTVAAGTAGKYDVTGTKVGGSYAPIDGLNINAVYEMAALKVDSDKVEQNNLYISGTYAVSDAGKVKLAYTMAGELKVAGATQKNTDASQVSVGYDHAMTKNTTLFASYSMIGNGKASSYHFSSSGSTADTTAAGSLTAGGKGDPTALSIGIRHSF